MTFFSPSQHLDVFAYPWINFLKEIAKGNEQIVKKLRDGIASAEKELELIDRSTHPEEADDQYGECCYLLYECEQVEQIVNRSFDVTCQMIIEDELLGMCNVVKNHYRQKISRNDLKGPDGIKKSISYYEKVASRKFLANDQSFAAFQIARNAFTHSLGYLNDDQLKQFNKCNMVSDLGYTVHSRQIRVESSKISNHIELVKRVFDEINDVYKALPPVTEPLAN